MASSADSFGEVPDPQVRSEERRDLVLEAVEPRERVLADRHDEPSAEARVIDRARQLGGERLPGGTESVVQEELLELVEHDQDVVTRLSRPALERFVEVGESGVSFADPPTTSATASPTACSSASSRSSRQEAK